MAAPEHRVDGMKGACAQGEGGAPLFQIIGSGELTLSL